jgi:pSer/pThr/pTyr-binding forkhead associated (FHA) protein
VDEPLAVALKFGFLAVLYLFLLWIARSSMRDLARFETAAPAAEPPEAPGSSRRRSALPDLAAGVDPTLEVVAAMGYEPGTTFDVRDGATLGRAESAEIRIDDPFASSAHARVFNRAGIMHLEDMGSTNGTYLDRAKVSGPTPVPLGVPIRIGRTSLELRP